MKKRSNFVDDEQIILSNLSNPDGFYGDIVSDCMNTVFEPVNQWTIDLMTIQPDESILEIGCGTGIAIEKLLQQTPARFVLGLDYAPLMIQKAAELNAETIVRGKAQLLQANIADLPDFPCRFDKVMAINSYMYWPEKMRVSILKHVRQHMVAGGSICISLYRTYNRFEQGGCNEQIQEIIQSLQASGFIDIQGICQTPENKEAARASNASICIGIKAINPVFSL